MLSDSASRLKLRDNGFRRSGLGFSLTLGFQPPWFVFFELRPVKVMNVSMFAPNGLGFIGISQNRDTLIRTILPLRV